MATEKLNGRSIIHILTRKLNCTVSGNCRFISSKAINGINSLLEAIIVVQTLPMIVSEHDSIIIVDI
jgi:hypothetical protein